jgi:FRG domain
MRKTQYRRDPKNDSKLRTIDQAVNIATTLTRSWFRGQSRSYDQLTPGIFRPYYEAEFYRAFRPQAEFTVIESFKRQAPAFVPQTPHQDDHVSWLFLMQHHGTPTRLLDWSKNALSALYFAVSQEKDEDGELWAMHPDALNKHNGFRGIPLPRNRILKYLAAEPALTNPKKFAKELGLKQIPKYPLAVDPPLNFSRMIAQQSAFTIHPRPEKGTTIPEILTDPKGLVRYIVPKSQKKNLLSDLATLGFKRLTLFPDLDSLSNDIVLEHNIVAYSPPDPPKW